MANDYDIFREQEAHRSRVMQTRENSARAARVYAMYTTTGAGELQVEVPFMFGCTFVREPAVLCGVSMPEFDTVGEPTPDLIVSRYPRISAGIYRWEWIYAADLNPDADDLPEDRKRKYYTGAYFFITVDIGASGVPADPSYVLNHTFAFEGLAYKNVLQNLTAKNVAILEG